MSSLNHESHRKRRKPRHSGTLLVWYFAFGAIHELSHYVTAWWLGYDIVLQQMDEALDHPKSSLLGQSNDRWVRLAYEIILGRQCSLPNLPRDLEDPVRHAGWISSCFLLILLAISFGCFNRFDQTVKRNKGNDSEKSGRGVTLFEKIMSNDRLVAAIVTAMEAITTDLFGWNPILPLNVGTIRQTFYCGNFGVILLNRSWYNNIEAEGGALDTLQQMIEVTMMRGAQSGGVVFYEPTNKKGNDYDDAVIHAKAVRSRVVNKKRTDLSKLVRSKVQKDLRRNAVYQDAEDFVPRFLAGHTRFATSSLSTLDGTHPHQWTPPSRRRVYSMDGFKDNFEIPRPAVITVENYITHNGDFDFYQYHGKTYELETIQNWLSVVTETTTPAAVDSCAIAGMVDILRTQGCFGLSARYTLVLAMDTSRCGLNSRLTPKDSIKRQVLPPYEEFLQDVVGVAFEKALEEFCQGFSSANEPVPTLREIGGKKEYRSVLQRKAFQELQRLPREYLQILKRAFSQPSPRLKVSAPAPSTVVAAVPKNPGIIITETDDDNQRDASTSNDIESNFMESDLGIFCQHTIDAFFDNDLFMTTKIFMQNAKGSFGLSVTSNLDSHRQMCLAARGQTISIAFYPVKDLICYGSEQAAVKAGMGAVLEEEVLLENTRHKKAYRELNYREVDNESTRLDLDDLGGEIVVLDWGRQRYQTAPVSLPNQHLEEHKLMNGKITAVLYQESKSTKRELLQRMTRLSDNPLIQPLQTSPDDPVLSDIQDIPSVCKNIQDDWHSRRASSSLNRLTAFNLSRCLRKRLEQHVDGTVPSMSVDILLTGCEVSLYLAEQFASDLKKAFPKLCIEAVSSNKLLGLYGQEIAVPSLGFPYSAETRNIHDSIVIIVSHSGGTFGPLACSNLLQSATRNIFVVTSEWDIESDGTSGHMLNQRIFSTEIGIRPAEPCSVSVAATHQLLTNLFEYLSVIVLSDPRFCRATKAQINEQDIQILERCNQMNINALTEIVGYNVFGYPLDRIPPLLNNIYELGNLWSDHILEQTRAYIMSFFYVFITVTWGWPLISAIGSASGVAGDSITYFLRFLDSCIYFWLPQICITIIRIVQGRNLRHRMVGRTVVIGDIPWVSQCADAFLSKCFAVSYSIAGLNVLSGNPSDHFVHRHTHRVVRGTLAIFGRPDGRLSALSTAEGSVCLSVNQASSIQSYGGTCESITIGHNPFTLNLAKTAIFLKRHRPLFLCERLLVETDANEEKLNRESGFSTDDESVISQHRLGLGNICKNLFSCFSRSSHDGPLSMSIHQMMDCSVSLKIHKQRNSHALMGAYLDINNQHKSSSFTNSSRNTECDDPGYDESDNSYSVDQVVADAIRDRKSSDRLHILFKKFDEDRDGILSESEFVKGLTSLDSQVTEEEARVMFRGADKSQSGLVDYNEFVSFLKRMGYDQQVRIPPSNRDNRGLIQIEASRERYFGETLRKYNAGKNKVQDMDFVLAQSQHLVQELYETRIASMQRFVTMCVLFHYISKRVERFFARISFGWWAYRIDRTHSIVRIATTASPISGSDVRQRIERLRLWKKVIHSVHVIEITYLAYRKRKKEKK
eukprot:CAMPEP_0116156094 /NCGR_PEP_ID=MMETSP0329-20121206/22651_1 /TAXON_ID=697910 /ORGANISM="Pseudo-nitzschia arenysensis, Strain B593" /LENGTH=1586 /DNA_ID=CAMNT_0003653159 /DNA_START=153 /DNA_END=4916 /DNA_ORIENTATION=-